MASESDIATPFLLPKAFLISTAKEDVIISNFNGFLYMRRCKTLDFLLKISNYLKPVLPIIFPLSTEYLTPDLHHELLSGDAEGPQLQWRGRLCCSVTQSCLTLHLHGLQHNRLPCSSPSPGACSDSCPLSW